MKKTIRTQQGFTLIELLVVIGILAVLLAITLIAINPAKQFQQANDTKRRSDVSAILNAIDQYAADHAGQLPAGITTSAKNISDTGANICSDLVTTYLAALPSDPTTGRPTGQVGAPCPATYNTNYQVIKSSSDSRVTVSATGEITASISVTR
jgi:prepilin-type N-terminal cleavage/methylation domain-containing protein